ncbi:hypothetical protein CEXT_623591 [Caerostris extrusa]|uniref:Enamelin n=1 Tax=Caerostris extrusa TaxID=172846 RepID=A0AAV4PIZ9_CAEEX|nr:hypothetical protein CEXT_623591 [Caerostris extrusa]
MHPQHDNDYHDGNKEPQTYSQPGNIYNGGAKPPQINSQEIEPQTYPQPGNIYNGDTNSPQINSQEIEPQTYPQPGNIYNGNTKSPQVNSPQEIEADKTPHIQSQQSDMPGGKVFFFKGSNGMPFDKSLFPALFELPQRNPIQIGHYSGENSPPTAVPFRPNYETQPLHSEEEHPKEDPNIPNQPPQNKKFHSNQMPLNHDSDSGPVPDRFRQNSPAINGEGHVDPLPHKEEPYQQLPPTYGKHYPEEPKISEEQYHELPPIKGGHHGAMNDGYQKSPPNNEENHPITPYKQSEPSYNHPGSSNENLPLGTPYQSRPIYNQPKPLQFNSQDESEEDCSEEDTDDNRPSGLAQHENNSLGNQYFNKIQI